jgi:hypothetical protein
MKSAALTFVTLLACATTANAAVNLVQNPGFETGDLTGWTANDPFVFFSASIAHSGNYSVILQKSTPYDVLSQNIPTTAGHIYQIDYYLRSISGGDFLAKWNGTQIPGSYVDVTLDYTLYSFQLPANSASTTLEFNGYNFEYQQVLDDVSVTDLGPVPEPTSLSLLALGTLALLRRRNLKSRI